MAEKSPPQAAITLQYNAANTLATVLLDCPQRKNALNAAMWSQLGEVFTQLNQQAGLRAVIIRGAGDEAFAAGGDIAEFQHLRTTLEDALHYHEVLVGSALQAIEDCPLPVIAAICGPALGGGLEIAAVCDLRIGGRSAKLGVPIQRLGFAMYPAEMALLRRLAGEAVALELLLEGRILDASEALAKGLLTRVVEDAAVFDEAEACAARILAGAPLVARAHKQWLRRLRDPAPLAAAEKRAALSWLSSADYAEGLAAFVEKRAPDFKGC